MSSWSEARLRKHLRTRYDRVTIQQVCAVKDQNYEPRDLAVWVRADREWSKLSPSRVQELWQANTKERSRSFCRFISRDLLKLSSQEYAGVKRSLESADSEELTGIYQARDASDDEYALVIEFPSSSALVRFNLLINLITTSPRDFSMLSTLFFESCSECGSFILQLVDA